MSAVTLWQVQQAVYGVLSADTTLMAMIEGVFDRVREQTAFPYVVLADGVADDVATRSAMHRRMQFEIEVYSRQGGRKEALAIASRIHTLLHEANPVLSSGAVNEMRVARTACNLLADGLTYLATVQLLVWVQ